MTKAKVYYTRITSAEQREINKPSGWDCPVGHSYLEAKNGAIAKNFDRFELAVLVEADNAEQIWEALQSIDAPWCEADSNIVKFIHTDFPRSMDVGDFIVWEDGRKERCATMGFEPIVLFGSGRNKF